MDNELGPIATEINRSLIDAVELSEASLNAIVNGSEELTFDQYVASASWVMRVTQEQPVVLASLVDDLMARVERIEGR
jgi:hypothetical protein